MQQKLKHTRSEGDKENTDNMSFFVILTYKDKGTPYTNKLDVLYVMSLKENNTIV